MRKTLIRIIAVLSLILVALVAVVIFCGPDRVQEPTITDPVQTQSIPATDAVPDTKPDYDSIAAKLAGWVPAGEIDLNWLRDTFGDEILLGLEQAMGQKYSREIWYGVTGNTWQALRRLQSGQGNILSPGMPGHENQTTTLVFGGDFSLADNWLPMQHLAATGGTVIDSIDPALVDILKKADVSFLVNEFCISDRGAPMADKFYTFRAKTANTAIYQQLGIDLVTLANNHVFDYGEEAFYDTMTALKDNGVAYIGGGKNLEEAMAAQYYLINGRVIAFVSATRAEKNIMTPAAGENSPGVLRCYDTALFVQAIQEAKANSDYVVACVHWGTEYSYTLEEAQTSSAREYIDAGADAIIGAHAHQLQGIEFYNGKPIFYNLGNFWFNDFELDSGLVELTIDTHGNAAFRFLPALQKDFTTTSQIGTDRGAQIIATLNQYCINATVNEDGTVTP